MLERAARTTALAAAGAGRDPGGARDCEYGSPALEIRLRQRSFTANSTVAREEKQRQEEEARRRADEEAARLAEAEAARIRAEEEEAARRKEEEEEGKGRVHRTAV